MPGHTAGHLSTGGGERERSSVVRSLHEGGDELLTVFRFPKAQWKTLRSTNVIERLNEEFRRRVKTQGSLPTEDAALVLLFGLVASGQIRLRRVNGWRQIPAVLSRRRPPDASRIGVRIAFDGPPYTTGIARSGSFRRLQPELS